MKLARLSDRAYRHSSATKGRGHGVRGPKELKNVGLPDHCHEALAPDLSGTQVQQVTQVSISQTPGVFLEILNDSKIPVGIRGKNVPEGLGAVAFQGSLRGFECFPAVHPDTEGNLSYQDAAQEDRQPPPGGLALQGRGSPEAELFPVNAFSPARRRYAGAG